MIHEIELHGELLLEVELAKAELQARESAVKKHVREYVGLNPLSKRKEVLLYSRVAANVYSENLCCSSGEQWLRENGFDSLWTEIINDWAYEALACKSYDSADYNLEKLERAFESNFGLNEPEQSNGHESNEKTQPMKNTIERISELESALRKRSPGHDELCSSLPRYKDNVKIEGACSCGHDEAMKVLQDDQLSVSLCDGTYRFYQTHDGAVCLEVGSSHNSTFTHSSGGVLALMRELLDARDKLIDLQGHAR